MFNLEKSDEHGAYAGSINLDNGIISFSAYSYHIDSTGYVELTKDETKHLYSALKAYYEKEGNHE